MQTLILWHTALVKAEGTQEYAQENYLSDQGQLFSEVETLKLAQPPSTRYQGSKLKLLTWIWKNIRDLKFHTALDAFGGTGSVAYLLKTHGKAVTYNDYLKFNTLIGTALIENATVHLNDEDVEFIFR